MSEVVIVRHGQAQTGAKNEASYDRLSDLGHQQAAWLGEHFRAESPFDRIVHGTMRRQIETATSLGMTGVPMTADDRLNELDYFSMAAVLRDMHDVAFPTEKSEFDGHVVQVLEYWAADNLGADVESYAAFCDRIKAAIVDAADHAGRTLIVSSTGVIATLAAMALGLDAARKSKLFLRVMHTSVHKFEVAGDEIVLSQFCATPHMDRADREGFKTFV